MIILVDGKNIQAKFIKIAPKLQAKVVIEMESIVCSSKYEMDSKSGYLSLGVGWEEK